MGPMSLVPIMHIPVVIPYLSLVPSLSCPSQVMYCCLQLVSSLIRNIIVKLVLKHPKEFILRLLLVLLPDINHNYQNGTPNSSPSTQGLESKASSNVPTQRDKFENESDLDLPPSPLLPRRKSSSRRNSTILHAPLEDLLENNESSYLLPNEAFFVNFAGEVASVAVSLATCVSLPSTLFSIVDKALTVSIILRVLLPLNKATSAVVKDFKLAVGDKYDFLLSSRCCLFS
jgi:hypothetical protein